MKRTLVIGDIHGGFKALVQVLKRANLNREDQLIFLGDYVDGWSESAQTIDYLIKLNQTNDCIFIRGNHDTWCQDWLETGKENTTWLFHGGESTIKSYENKSAETIENHLNFFECMKDYYIDPENNLFIHAGFSSIHGPSQEHYSSNFSWDRTLWETAVSLDPNLEIQSAFFPKRLLLFKEIFIGHTPTLAYNITTPMNKANVWNIDNGAAFTGKLSVLDIETKEFWQSDILMDLYPNEKGRNK